MSFSFNWAGLNVPTIAGKREVQIQNQQADVAGKLGAALRGYERRVADNEYADILAQDTAVDQRVIQIQAEIARLEQRNAEIRNQLGGV